MVIDFAQISKKGSSGYEDLAAYISKINMSYGETRERHNAVAGDKRVVLPISAVAPGRLDA